MIAFAISQFQQLDAELKSIIEQERDILSQSEKCIDRITFYMNALKAKILTYEFKDPGEEIEFFKNIKPKFLSRLIYHASISDIEAKQPTGGFDTHLKYLSKQLAKLKVFFDDNREFYLYHRTGSTYLDDKYFLRKESSSLLHSDPHVFSLDRTFSTSHDFTIAKILANDMVKSYLMNSIVDLEHKKMALSKASDEGTKKLNWTASKTALIELAYGLHASGVFNNSTADVRQIATYLEFAFNVDLGNYYRTFQEIRVRKSGRTNFIDEMRKKLIQRMEDTDINPRERSSE